MKKLLASALAVTVALGAAGAAEANWFTKDKSKDEANARVETRTEVHNENYIDSKRNVYGDNMADTRQEVRVGDERVRVETPVGYDATAHDAEAQKWIYNGSSAYRGGLSGQIAVREGIEGNDRAFVTRPVRGTHNQFNASLRSGDMSQSDETRLNHAFNN